METMVLINMFFIFFFLNCSVFLPLNTPYLWDFCKKVGISKWKGSYRQCYALCIHSICRKHSCLRSCKPVIYWQHFSKIWKKDTDYLYISFATSLHTWKTSHVVHPKNHQMQGSVTSVRTSWANCLVNRHTTKRAVLIRRGLFCLLTQRQRRQAINRAFDPWNLLCSCHFIKRGTLFGSIPTSVHKSWIVSISAKKVRVKYACF